MRIYLVSLLFVAFLGTGVTLAQTEGEVVAEAETVTTADLGIRDPGLLPTSRIYFLKEWRRGFQRFFTFNPVARTELELKITNAKAAEAKKVEEQSPQDPQAISRAIQNYREGQERLRARFEALRETSQNPNVERLLEQFADHAVKHEKLFDELAKKFESRAEIQEVVLQAKEKVEEALARAAEKDDPAKFAAKLEKALVASKGDELKHVRSVEILERFAHRAPEEVKERLERLREEFSLRLEEDLEKAVERNLEEVRTRFSELPGDVARHALILDEIRAKAEEKAERGLARALEEVSRFVEEAAEREFDIVEKAREQIEDAQERVAKLAARLEAVPNPPQVARNLLAQAQDNLKRAQQAFEAEKYGEAFGQARSAEVLARNGLRILEEERPEVGDLEEDLEELAIKIEKYAELLGSQGLTPQNHPQASKLLDNAREHLGFGREAFAKNDIAGVKLHIGHIKGFLRELASLLEARVRESGVAPRAPVEAIACPAVFLPACEKDRRSEECVRAVKELVAKYPRCGFEKLLEEPAAPPAVEKPSTSACTQDYAPVCGVDGKTYSNECFARVAGVALRSKGECALPSKEPEQPSVAPAPEPTTTAAPVPSTAEFKLEADDRGFYPNSIVNVRKGSKVRITFIVRREGVYFGGLDFRSRKFETSAVKPGESTTVEFVADEPFDFYSYWPASGVLKSTGKVIVE